MITVGQTEILESDKFSDTGLKCEGHRMSLRNKIKSEYTTIFDLRSLEAKIFDAHSSLFDFNVCMYV